MGRRRGQRNAAREKFWPGQDAAEIREFHETGGVRQKFDLDDATIALPTVAITHKQAKKLEPLTEFSTAVRRARAEGTYTLPPLIFRQVQKRFAASFVSKKKPRGSTLAALLGPLHWDKIGRVHYLLMLLRASNRYALPQAFHELDPMEIMLMAEQMNLAKATYERFPRLAR